MTAHALPLALHYFRIPRPAWELLLVRLRQLGVQTVYTPLPWGFHEFADGKFDLTGQTTPRRDVVGFVETCTAMGLQVVLDLTPAPGADLLHGGLPGWLLHRHPEIQARNRQGDPLPAPTLEHPTFLKFVERWYGQVGQAFDATPAPGAPVQAQLSAIAPTPNYSEHVARVQWPIWLRKRYAEGGVEALNAAYAPPTPFRSVADVP
ncbi:MAG: hypothetical protein D6796_09345, partial [Caldilineae bacterium]